MAGKEFKCGYRSADIEAIDRMPHEECKKLLAGLSKGIAHPVRIQIVNILANKPDEDRCMCGDIVNVLPLAQSSVSQHLKVLKETGWIHGEIQGPSVCYCLVGDIVDYYRRLLTRVILTDRKEVQASTAEAVAGTGKGHASENSV